MEIRNLQRAHACLKSDINHVHDRLRAARDEAEVLRTATMGVFHDKYAMRVTTLDTVLMLLDSLTDIHNTTPDPPTTKESP